MMRKYSYKLVIKIEIKKMMSARVLWLTWTHFTETAILQAKRMLVVT